MIISLVTDFHLMKDEALLGAKYIRDNGIKNILPSLYVKAVLFAMMESKQKKEIPNDHFDILRLSTAIPFADIILTDGSKVHDIKQSSLDSDFNTEVFSGGPEGLSNFTDRLKSLAN